MSTISNVMYVPVNMYVCTQVVRRLQVPGTTVLPRSCITWSLPCVPGYRIFKNYNLL